MKQEGDVDTLVRQRIRGLRVARGWSLDDLAGRCHLSPSNLSRIETGHRRIALDQLAVIARALGTTLDQLVESADDEDVVIRPLRDVRHGTTTWMLTAPERAPYGVSVAKIRMTRSAPADGQDDLRVHPGRDWFTVLSGTARLRLGERVILVEAGQAAEFSTMIPHAISAQDGPAEILCIFDHDGDQAHLRADHRHASGAGSVTADQLPDQGVLRARWSASGREGGARADPVAPARAGRGTIEPTSERKPASWI
jgi:transcriptional regulator with XRE-family HTH domain